MHVTRAGTGPKLLLIHGVGSDHRTWREIVPALATDHEVWAIDLPGHGSSPAEEDSGTFEGVLRSTQRFLESENLLGVDMVGSSLGGRVVLELSRRGHTGNVVALAPAGFWAGWERTYLQMSLLSSFAMMRVMRPGLPYLAHASASRTALLAQLCFRPWALDGDLVEHELQSLVATPNFVDLVNDQASAPGQVGSGDAGGGNVTVGWGRHDRLCLPLQAMRAQAAFAGARLHWFEEAGHYAHWDAPQETIELIRHTLGEGGRA